MQTPIRTSVVLAIVLMSAGSPALAQHHTKQGAAAMDFDQDAATHHFRLLEHGGTIEVIANRPEDAATIGRVRTHLTEIAAAFARGDFSKPFATHGEMPPGVRVMQARKDVLAFRYEEMPAGGRVRITTADTHALAAVHEFLRYQVREHRTGDRLTVAK